MARDRRWPWTWSQTRPVLVFVLGAGLLVFEAFSSFIGRGSNGEIITAACGVLGGSMFLIEKSANP